MRVHSRPDHGSRARRGPRRAARLAVAAAGATVGHPGRPALTPKAIQDQLALVTGLPADPAGSSRTTGKPHMQEVPMATTKQTKAARRNVTRAQKAAASKQTIAHMPKQTRTALGKQGAAVAQRKRTGSDSPKTRAELYEIAKQRDLPGRSKMGRDELARKLGEN